jgi:hypothetical protein
MKIRLRIPVVWGTWPTLPRVSTVLPEIRDLHLEEVNQGIVLSHAVKRLACAFPRYEGGVVGEVWCLLL